MVRLSHTTFLNVTLCLGAWLFFASAAYSQTGQGTLTGSVTDTSGAIVSGVSVLVRNQNTGFTYNAVTTQEGIYRVPYLNVGSYEVAFEAAGFKKLARKDIPIRSTETLRLDVTLEVGRRSGIGRGIGGRSVAGNRNGHNGPPGDRNRVDYTADAADED